MKEELQNTHGGSLKWEFELYCQPPNSPDINVNNLCFFASLQLLQYHNPTNSLHKIMIKRLRLDTTNIHEQNWITHFLLYNRPVWIRWLSVMEGLATRWSTWIRQG
jgi:hypothetical protein